MFIRTKLLKIWIYFFTTAVRFICRSFDEECLLFRKKNNLKLKYLARVAKKRKIKVLFIVEESAKWKCQSVYDAMLEHPVFLPQIAIIANISRGKAGFEYLRRYKMTLDFFESKGIPTTSIFNQKDKKNDLMATDGDIVFIQHPWGWFKDEICNLAAIAPVCYVPYMISNTSLDIEYNLSSHAYLWKYYLLNEDFKNYYAQRMTHNKESLYVAGHPTLDCYLEHGQEKEKKFVIYAPHFSITDNSLLRYGTFCWNGRYLLEYAQKNKEVGWLFKPHPELRHALLKNGVMSEKEVDAYYMAWLELGGVCDEGGYIDYFMASKALITDCGSFLTEYMPTKQPVIHLHSPRAVPFHAAARIIVDSYYQAANTEELGNLLDKILLRGEDQLKEQRLRILDESGLIAGNSGRAIVNDLEAELGLAKS